MARNPNMKEAILGAAELLFSENSFDAVSIRDIAEEAGANPGSVTYHFKSKDGLLLEIYRRHCGPINRRRSELLAAAKHVRDLQDRLAAIVRAYVLPAFLLRQRYRRWRGALHAAARGDVGRRQRGGPPHHRANVRRPSHAFIDAIHESLPHIPRTEIVWRSHFLLGALYYALVTPERVTRLSRGRAEGTDAAEAIEQLVRATVAALQAPPVDQPVTVRPRSARKVKA